MTGMVVVQGVDTIHWQCPIHVWCMGHCQWGLGGFKKRCWRPV